MELLQLCYLQHNSGSEGRTGVIATVLVPMQMDR